MKYNITNTNVCITSNFYIFLNIWNYAPFLYFCMQLYKLFCSRALDKFILYCVPYAYFEGYRREKNPGGVTRKKYM